MTVVWALDLAYTDKFVLLALADNANDEGACWPSIETIVRKTSLSERAVQYSIKRLAEASYLSITKRSGHSTLYRLTPARGAPVHDMHPAPDAPTPARGAPPGVQEVHLGGARGAPRTLKESSSEPSREPTRAPEEVRREGNHLPPDWDQQLRSAYPKRSGPSGFGGVKLMLKVRSALANHPFDKIMAGVRRYAEYTRQSGEEGTQFVKAPANFFDEGLYLEEFTYQTAVDPKVTEHKRQEAERWSRAIAAAGELRPALEAYPQESVAAFETRIRMQGDRRLDNVSMPSQSSQVGRSSGQLSARITDLAARMKA